MTTVRATTFDALVREHLDEAFRLNPLFATSAGVHDHDDRWPDLSATGRAALLDSVDRWDERLRALDPADLAADQVIDRDRLLLALAAQHFELTELREDAWDPLSWVYVLGDGLFGLLARDFAPPAVRLTSFAGRLEGLPAITAAATAALGSLVPGGRPVSRFHTERALQDLAGIGSLIDEGLALATRLEASPATDALRARLDDGAAAARAALAGLEVHLRDAVLPASEGEGRLGSARFAAKLAHTVSDPALTVERILATAEAQYDAIRTEMARLAGHMWSAARPGQAPPTDAGELVRAMLDEVAADHPAADELLEACRAALVRIEAFCRETGFIGLVEEPLEITWTPEFLRGWAGAMLMSPGPFERTEKTLFCVTPVPTEWDDALRESYLREMNRVQIDILTIHEAVPGHYLQGAYGNRAPSVVRAVYGDGMYAEGWAVYVTQALVDAGYRADDPAFLLNHWKYYLRAVVNAIIDIRIHTAGMSEAEALELMIRGAFQEEGEAIAKYRRARLTSTQLSTYFVGSLGLWDIEAEARRRAAGAGATTSTAATAPAATAPWAAAEQTIVGGYGDTPGFDARTHREALIAHGELPLPLLRRVMLG
jgi:uncharacterized protein (DUF885 family)